MFLSNQHRYIYIYLIWLKNLINVTILLWFCININLHPVLYSGTPAWAISGGGVGMDDGFMHRGARLTQWTADRTFSWALFMMDLYKINLFIINFGRCWTKYTLRLPLNIICGLTSFILLKWLAIRKNNWLKRVLEKRENRYLFLNKPRTFSGLNLHSSWMICHDSST